MKCKSTKKITEGQFGLETTIPKLGNNANQFVLSIDFDHVTIVDMAHNFHETATQEMNTLTTQTFTGA